MTQQPKSRGECKDAIAKERGYPSWTDYYNWIAREGQRPDVVAQLIESATEDAMEAYAEQQRGCGRWVKASERLPEFEDRDKKYVCRYVNSKHPIEVWSWDIMNNHLSNSSLFTSFKFEWLDESPCECQQLREVLEKISKGHPDGNPQNLIDIATAAIADAGKEHKDENQRLREMLQHDPYPEKIFKPLTEMDLENADKALDHVLGFRLDRLSAQIGREIRKGLLASVSDGKQKEE